MAPRSRAKWAYRTSKKSVEGLSERFSGAAQTGEAAGQLFLADPDYFRGKGVFMLALFYLLLGAQILGETLAGVFRAIDRALPDGVDRGQSVGGFFAVIGLLVVLLIAGIILILGPTLLALLTDSLPSTNNTRWNSTYNSVADNVDTAYVLGGLLVVIVVIGAMITVLVSSFLGGAMGGGGGGFM